MKKNGFTLVELMLVISIISILTAVLVQVVNPRRSQGAARDGVRMANMEKLVQAIEAYGAAEGKYPEVGAGKEFASTTPTTGTMSTGMSFYIKNWPEPEFDAAYAYQYFRTGSDYVLYVKTERGTGAVTSCLKFASSVGKLLHCNAGCTTPSSTTCTPY